MSWPDDLLFCGYEVLSSFLPFLLVLLFLARFYQKRGLSAVSCAGILLFTAYIAAVYHFTGAGTLYEGLRYQTDLPEHINFVPFSNRIDLTEYILNVALFLPLGLLVPLIWDRTRRLLPVLGLGAIFSVFIEATQLLNIRATDVDDVIMNLTGAALGFAAFKSMEHATHPQRPQNTVPMFFMPLCILVPYLGRFFLYNDMGLARLLYGF